MIRIIFLILFLLWALPAQAATKTLCPSGCDFSSGSAWITYLQGISPLAAPEILEVSGSNETTIQSSGTITTSAANYIEIKGAASCKHAGVYDVSKCELKRTSGDNHIIYMDGGHGVNHVRIRDLLFSNSSENADTITVTGLAAAHVRVYNNIIRSTDASPTAAIGISLGSPGSGTANMYIYNNMVYGFGGRGIACEIRTDDTCFIYNNTAARNGIGIRPSCQTGDTDSYKMRNNLAVDNTTDYSFTANGCAGPKILDNNGSEDGSGTAGDTGLTPTFVDVGSDDYRLDAGDTSAIDTGSDLSADGDNAITDDLIGTARPQGSAFDKGAFEYLAGGPPTGGDDIIMLEDY